MTPDDRETLEQLYSHAASRAEWDQSWMGPTDPAWDVDDLAECVEAVARWGRRALALRAALASPEAAPPAPADLVARIHEFAVTYERDSSERLAIDALLIFLAAPRVPERDTPDEPFGRTDTRCAGCGHDADRHFKGGRCMTVPCMCQAWKPSAPPTPPQEGE